MGIRSTASTDLWFLVAYLILSRHMSSGFSICNGHPGSLRGPYSQLFGINEWRSSNSEQKRRVFMLPFCGSEILLPGERKTIVLKDGRFFDLFQDVVDQEHGVVGMALMGEDYLLPTVILCEIHDYQIDTGFRGRISIQVTLESVARAEMLELVQVKPVMKAVCQELEDTTPVIDVENELTKNLVKEVRDLSMEISSHAQSFGSSSKRSLTSDQKPKFVDIEYIDTLTWESLSLIREKVRPEALLEIVQTKQTTERLTMVHRLLQGYLSSLRERLNGKDGALLDEPSSFE